MNDSTGELVIIRPRFCIATKRNCLYQPTLIYFSATSNKVEQNPESSTGTKGAPSESAGHIEASKPRRRLGTSSFCRRPLHLKLTFRRCPTRKSSIRPYWAKSIFIFTTEAALCLNPFFFFFNSKPKMLFVYNSLKDVGIKLTKRIGSFSHHFWLPIKLYIQM